MSAFSRSALVLIALFLCFSSMTVYSFADSPGENVSAVGYSEAGIKPRTGPDGESDGYSVGQSDFALNADKLRVSLGESFKVEASFSQVTESNAASLTCSYNPDEIEFLRFEPDEGVVVLNEEVMDGEIRLTFMILGNDLLSFGNFSFAAGDSPEIYGRECAISASTDYVLREEGSKIVFNASSSAEILLAAPGDVNRDGLANLLDLSDMIDFFGADATDLNWSRVKWFDINGDDFIDIFDLAHIASVIADFISI